MRWQTVLAVPAAVLVVVAAGFIFSNPEVEQKPATTLVAGPVAETSLSIQPAVDVEVERQALPASLVGTHHGVRLVSTNGELLVSASLKDLFDYYLSALGEVSVDQIRQLILRNLEQQLADTALRQAAEILDNYLGYKASLEDFEADYQQQTGWNKQQQLAFFNERQQALIALQDRLLGAQVAQVFFAFDRKLDRHTLNKAHILNSDMTADGKQQALVNLNAELPIEVQLQQQRNQQQGRLAEIDKADLSPQDKFQQRAQVVGEAAAQRLTQLDQQRTEWDKRLQEFKLQVNGLKDFGLAADDYNQAYEKLLKQHFQPHEQLRAKVLTSD